MNEAVEFIIRVKDEGSAPLAKFSRNVNREVNKVTKLFSGVENGITKTITKTNNLRRAFSGLSKGVSGISRYNKSLKASEGYLDRLLNKTNRLARVKPSSPIGQSSGVASSAPGIFSMKRIAAFGGAYLGLREGGNIIKMGAEMEQTRLQFDTLLGSVEKSKKMVSDINSFANVTPFTNGDLFESSKMLLNFGLEGEKVLPIMKMLGDVAGGNRDRFQRLSLVFGQTQSAGRLMGQDLLQYISAGFNPLNELSKITGKSMAKLKEEMSEGAISADMVTQAFQLATSKGGRFFGMMEKQSQSLSGRWSTFVGKMQLRLTTFAEGGLNGVLKRLVNFGIEFIDRFSPISEALKRVYNATLPLRLSITNLGRTIFGVTAGGSAASQAVLVLTNAFSFLTPIIQTVSGWMGYVFNLIKNNWGWLSYLSGAILTLVVAYKAWAIATGIIRTATLLLNTAMYANPIGLIIGGVVILASVVLWAWNRFEGFRGAIFGVWEVMKEFADGIGNLFTSPMETIKGVFNDIALFFAKQVMPLFDLIDAIKEGRWADAAMAGGKFLFNMSGIGMIYNMGTALAGKESFKSGYEEGKKEKNKLTFADMVPTIPSISNFMVQPDGQLMNVLASQPLESNTKQEVVEAPTLGFGNVKSQQTGRVLNVNFDALLKEVTFNVNNSSDADRIRTVVVETLMNAVKDVELSY